MAKVQVSSILRALQILECFMDRETEWTLKELVDHLDLPSTTVFRQVSTLAERQYLVQDPVRKSYRVGPRLMLLASAILGQSDLRRVARPELEHLSDTVHETINLSGRRPMPPAAARRCFPARTRHTSTITASG